MQQELQKHLRHNFIVNVIDGGFFGVALGIASFVSVIPLFVATLTDNTAIIGMVTSLHLVGWQLPQLFTAQRVAQLRRYKPMVVLMTMHERLPFVGLALTALLVPVLGRDIALVLTIVLLTWQGVGGGLTATPWQSMIAKIMPARFRGTFYGLQSSAAALFSTGGALLAGVVLTAVEAPYSYALCFFIAALGMTMSYVFLSWTREPESEPTDTVTGRNWGEFRQHLLAILKRDGNLRWFILARMLAQVSAVGSAFYTVYATRRFDMSAELAGIMTAVLMIAQIAANVLLGWMGDRWGHRSTLALGILLTGAAALLAMAAPSVEWFYAVFALAGVAVATLWTNIIAMTAEFGTHSERPYYIGLANTLVAPATLLAPVAGGWLADAAGFEATFLLAGAASVLTAFILFTRVKPPQQKHHSLIAAPSPAAGD